MKLKDLMSGYENLSEPPASQANVSITKITVIGLPVLMVAYFAFLWAANAWLPAMDAERVKGMLDTVFPILLTVVGGGGIGSLFGRSLLLTQGKIKAQTPPQPDTVNVGSAQTVNAERGESTAAGFVDIELPSDADWYGDSEPLEPDYQPATYEEAVEAVRA